MTEKLSPEVTTYAELEDTITADGIQTKVFKINKENDLIIEVNNEGHRYDSTDTAISLKENGEWRYTTHWESTWEARVNGQPPCTLFFLSNDGDVVAEATFGLVIYCHQPKKRIDAYPDDPAGSAIENLSPEDFARITSVEVVAGSTAYNLCGA